MTKQPQGSSGATPTLKRQWKSINWVQIRKSVHHLQVRIAKAVINQRWGKVQSLQHILVTSMGARLLAVKIVTSSKGKWTPGIDGVVWKSATAKFMAAVSLKKRGYKAQPLRRVHIRKTNGKLRPLGIPTMKDRAMQALYAMALEPIAEIQADEHSYGFRPRRCVQDAIQQCRAALACKNRATWILEGDIKACFDQIDHDWMLSHIPMDKTILRQWLKAGFIENDLFNRTDAGTPQGSPISPILANMVLDELQAKIKEAAPKGGKVNFIRYADDFICTAKDSQILTDIILPVIQNFMSERGLELSPEKTLVTQIDKGFDFLGYNIRKYEGSLTIKPAKEKVKQFTRKLKGCLTTMRFKHTHHVVSALNKKLQGWANAHRHCAASKFFSKIEHYLFQATWRELKRRHPKKPAKWIKRRYFTSRNNYNWVLHGEEMKDGKKRTHYLLQMSTCRYRRHNKVKAAATPFDPDFVEYFKKRDLYKLIARKEDKRRRVPNTTPWRRHLKGQMDLFPAGL